LPQEHSNTAVTDFAMERQRLIVELQRLSPLAQRLVNLADVVDRYASGFTLALPT
jgi:hypothetical protein